MVINSILVWPLRMIAELGARAGCGLPHKGRQIGRQVDTMVLVLHHHIAYAQIGFGRRTVRQDISDQGAGRTLHAKRFGQLARDILNGHANPATLHMPTGLKLLRHLHGNGQSALRTTAP